MAADVTIDRYEWAGGSEAMLRFGPSTAPRIAVATALFEEANRMRAFIVALCRALAARGVASVVPDLPGTGDSLIETGDARLQDWSAAFAAAAMGADAILAIRGGALVAAGDAATVYQLAPVAGAALIRDLVRARAVAEPGFAMPANGPVDLSGNHLARAMIDALGDAVPPAASRIARLASETAPADVRFDGRPLWRAAEPARDEALAIAVAADIVAWMPTCGG